MPVIQTKPSIYGKKTRGSGMGRGHLDTEEVFLLGVGGREGQYILGSGNEKSHCKQSFSTHFPLCDCIDDF